MEGSQNTIGIAPINLAAQEENLIRELLHVEGNGEAAAGQYVLLGGAQAKGAPILLANIDTTDFNRANQLLKQVYAAKATVFVVHDARSLPQIEYKYLIRRKDLAQHLRTVLDNVSREELRLEFKLAEQKSNGQVESRSKKYIGRVLVVDDSPSVRTQMQLFLGKHGCECYLAENAEEALRAVKQIAFDLIFMDIVMPGVDGYQACKAIKSLNGGKQTPVILLTSKNSPIDKIHGIMSGCDKYLTKPVRASELNGLLQAYFPVLKQALEVKTN